MRLAAIDIGTNTVRLIVADAEGERFTDVERDKRITRLGQGVDEQRQLDPEAMDRTVAAIEVFAARAKELGATRIRVVGTSALRDAADRDAFGELVADRTGERLEILSGHDEAKLSLLGATTDLPHGPTYVVCDIGGGSTEISTSHAYMSLDIGSVRLKERLLKTEPPTSDEVNEARHFIDATLEETEGLLMGGFEKLVGVGGTITTLAALAAGLEKYDSEVVHGRVISRSAVIDWSKHLLTMTPAEILELGPVDPGRADVVAGGVLILKRVMIRFLFDEVLVSEADILDGLVLDLAATL